MILFRLFSSFGSPTSPNAQRSSVMHLRWLYWSLRIGSCAGLLNKELFIVESIQLAFGFDSIFNSGATVETNL